MADDSLSQIFGALADPTRRAILARLSRGEASVSELAAPFLGQMSPPAITKHLKVLEKAGLITKTRDAQWRPCKLNGEPFKNVVDWVEQYRVFWEESLDRLDAYLKTVTAAAAAESPGPASSAAARQTARRRAAIGSATKDPAANDPAAKNPAAKNRATTNPATKNSAPKGQPRERKKPSP